ncbi:Hsp20 family protein [Methanoculleus sp. FWC-SCC1]|uniref:Hsp20 family protein n=1 Tax=Methanoculleus frigidifontis TaxID=2584085 RepID=A0ABT8M8L6_9EURY|nr:Hsp20 family protein [Methanoculleus sp. FWC-SCC1]MDN7024261.1 Hsp20 family protein [Methanoculleus sp. FWC-SCC1]
MARRGSPYGMWSEFDEMIAEMRRQFGEMLAGLREAPGTAMLPGAGMLVDVSEHPGEVVIAADCPGVERQDVSLRLLDPMTLRIAIQREAATETEREGYYMRERTVGAVSRDVSLPAEVTEQGAQATFKNGVLEVRLPKTPEARGREIAVAEEPDTRVPGSAAEAERNAARLRQQKEEELREAREKIEPSGYLSSEKLEEEARDVELEQRGSPEERRTAAELRQQKEEERAEAKRKLG